ncbi:hypothetical protein GALMADRAFT_465959 [Galerina marginata CBS 339.88]|uniref:Uncharacterized protein n=1 Tax=Galerina marginata (strain CBS 339.88) TaxID=685588 RepID=A0A067SZ37_GALM3|nr:hypothetical protein GALMADRAFT_465959 [Galerina marginata CBS 339.88]
MPIVNDPFNKPHPPPPPPDLGDGPNVPKGNKRTTCAGNASDIVLRVQSHDPQKPDHRRALGIAPGDQGSNLPGALTYSGHGGPGGYGGYGPGYGGYFGGPPPPPGTVGPYSGGGSPLVQQWREFFQNQPVEVNIQGNGWVVGAVVAAVHAFQSIGSTVKVRFRRPQYRHQEEGDFPNEPSYIRPLPPKNPMH